MSLYLNRLGTDPQDLFLKTLGFVPEQVILGDTIMPIEEFLSSAREILINDELVPHDPRRQLVKSIKTMKEVKGFGKRGKRLATKSVYAIDKNSITQVIRFRGNILCMEDFAIAVYYVLTNTNLYKGDPRRKFVEDVKSSQEVPGSHPEVTQLELG